MNKSAMSYINKNIMTYLVSVEVISRMKNWALAFNVIFEYGRRLIKYTVEPSF